MNKKIFFVCLFVLGFFSTYLFANDNMRIFPKEQGEVITGFKTASLPEEVKITIAYPEEYPLQAQKSFPLVFLFDTEEYSIEDLKQMYYQKENKNPSALIASFRFKNTNLSQEQFDNFIAETFAFFEVNYRTESDPSKRLVLAANSMALLALNLLNSQANYFLNLGMLLNNTTSLPVFDIPFRKAVRIFCFAPKTNIVRLQNLLEGTALKPMQNFFFKIQENASFTAFDLRYFFSETAKIKQIKPIVKKEILQEEPIYLQVKTNYGVLDFLPNQIYFAPPILAYDNSSGLLKVLLPDQTKVKIKGVFAGKKWSKSVKILN